MSLVSIKEAAQRLEVAETTVRRRIRNGDVRARQVARPQGFVWMVDLPDNEPDIGEHVGSDGISPELVGALKDTIRRQDEALEQLRHQLQIQVTMHQEGVVAKDRQIEQLHVLLQQAQAALPAPKENRQSWWRFWQR